MPLSASLGLELARAHRPDLILLDLHLPDRSGLDVLVALRRDPVTAHIPVVVLTADASATQAQRLAQAGASRYLTKPLVLDEILATLDGITRRRHSRSRSLMHRRLEQFSAMSVLVVDDNPSNVMLLKTLLEDEGLLRITTLTTLGRSSTCCLRWIPTSFCSTCICLTSTGTLCSGRSPDSPQGLISRYWFSPPIPPPMRETARLSDGARDYLTKPFDTVEVALRVGNLLETRQLYGSLRRTALAHIAATTEAELLERREKTLDVLRNRSITPHYQPVVEMATRAIVGHEALARFPAPHEHGPAGWFLDASSVGLGTELEWLAATTSLEFLQMDAARGFLAVNMSPAAILHLFHAKLCEEHLCPRIVIELTEHVPIEDYAPLHRALSDMRDARRSPGCGRSRGWLRRFPTPGLAVA